MFDGVHEGHARLMRTANELAALHDLTSVVYTFSSHPMATFAPDRVPPQLETRSEKVRTIAQLGVDVAVLRPFDRAYAALSPEEFVRTFAEALHPHSSSARIRHTAMIFFIKNPPFGYQYLFSVYQERVLNTPRLIRISRAKACEILGKSREDGSDQAGIMRVF